MMVRPTMLNAVHQWGAARRRGESAVRRRAGLRLVAVLACWLIGLSGARAWGAPDELADLSREAEAAIGRGPVIRHVVVDEVRAAVYLVGHFELDAGAASLLVLDLETMQVRSALPHLDGVAVFGMLDDARGDLYLAVRPYVTATRGALVRLRVHDDRSTPTVVAQAGLTAGEAYPGAGAIHPESGLLWLVLNDSKLVQWRLTDEGAPERQGEVSLAGEGTVTLAVDPVRDRLYLAQGGAAGGLAKYAVDTDAGVPRLIGHAEGLPEGTEQLEIRGLDGPDNYLLAATDGHLVLVDGGGAEEPPHVAAMLGLDDAQAGAAHVLDAQQNVYREFTSGQPSDRETWLRPVEQQPGSNRLRAIRSVMIEPEQGGLAWGGSLPTGDRVVTHLAAGAGGGTLVTTTHEVIENTPLPLPVPDQQAIRLRTGAFDHAQLAHGNWIHVDQPLAVESIRVRALEGGIPFQLAIYAHHEPHVPVWRSARQESRTAGEWAAIAIEEGIPSRVWLQPGWYWIGWRRLDGGGALIEFTGESDRLTEAIPVPTAPGAGPPRHVAAGLRAPGRWAVELIGAPAVVPTVLRVPEDIEDLQAAIVAAADGARIDVAPGVWRGPFFMLGRELELVARESHAPERTVLEGDGQSAVVRYWGTEAAGRIEGFTIRGGGRGGISGREEPAMATRARATIRGNVIQRNAGYDGGGVREMGGLVENNLIETNFSDRGGGISSFHGTIRGNRIIGNYANDGGGIALATGGEIEFNHIVGNHAEIGGGVWRSGRVVNNFITDNDAWYGAAVQEAGMVAGNLIARNFSWDLAGAAVHTAVDVVNNTVVENTDIGSSVIQIRDVERTIVNNIVWRQGESTGVAVAALPETFSNNIIREWPEDDPLNFRFDPRFRDAPAGDYRPAANSPAVDRGQRPPEGVPELDLDGLARGIWRGGYDESEDATGYDIGAWELHEPLIARLLDTAPTLESGGSYRVEWSAQPLLAGTAVGFDLQDDGAEVARLGTQWHPDAGGVFMVTLPSPLEGDTFFIRVYSLFDPAIEQRLGPFAIRQPKNAVPPSVWRAYGSLSRSR